MTMTESRIGLNIGLGPGTTDLPQPEARPARRDASDADRQAFEQALDEAGHRAVPADCAAPDESERRAGREAEGRHDSRHPVSAEPEDLTPFSLFSGMALPGGIRADVPSELALQLSDAADRLLVGDGGSGRREVRIDLKAEVLPGVAMSVYEEAASLVVEFSCEQESSRDTLNQCAQQLADELAGSLSRPTVIRVRTNDPDDLRLLEVAGAAG